MIAIERDERALGALAEISAHYPGRLDIVCADAMTYDPRPLLGGARAKIVANLPYNIATPLLIGWLETDPWPPWYDCMVLMFQREVAERIVATEDDEAYGRLGVLANWRAQTKMLFDISPAAFVPPPKVTSSVVRLIPRDEPRALRPSNARAGHRRGVRTAPQDAAAEPEVARRRSGAARRCGRRRSDATRGDDSGRGLCCHGQGIGEYTRHKI